MVQRTSIQKLTSLQAINLVRSKITTDMKMGRTRKMRMMRMMRMMALQTSRLRHQQWKGRQPFRYRSQTAMKPLMISRTLKEQQQL